MPGALIPRIARPSSRPAFFWIVSALAALLLGAYAFAAAMIARYGSFARDWGWDYQARGSTYHVVGVREGGPAAGALRDGDRILAIDGEARLRAGVRWTDPIWLRRRAVAPDRAYAMRVERDGAALEIRLRAPLRRDESRLGVILSLLAVSFVFYLNGVFLGLVKPGERVVRIASLSSLATALMQLGNTLAPMNEHFRGAELAGFFAVAGTLPFHLALGYHFVYRFPDSVPSGRPWTLLKWGMYVWAAVLFGVFRFAHGTILGDEAGAIALFSEHGGAFASVWKLYDGFVLFSLVAMVVVLARNYRLVREPDQRRRIRWIVYGFVAGTFPWLVVGLARVLLAPRTALSSEAFQIANLALAIIPVTTAYAVLKHRAMDIHLVIRRGVQYLLAKGVLWAILLVQVVAVSWVVLFDREKTLGDLLTSNSIYLLLFATTAVTLAFRARVSEWIDRRFFREAYEEERILLGLVGEIRGLDSMTEISRLVSRKLEAALHPKAIYVFYREGERGDLSLGHSSGGLSHDVHLPETSGLLRHMEAQDGPRGYPFRHDGDLPAEERAWLDGIGVELVVPMRTTDEHLLGLLLLGEKKSEEPYTESDRKLLQAIAGQMAVVHENTLLKSRVDRERKIKHDVLARLGEGNVNLVQECPTCGVCQDSGLRTCPEDGSELTLSLPVERTLDGKYRLDRLIGRGGMGAVYQATDLRLRRPVAVKVLLGSFFGDRAALRRFEREARAAAKLSHPNIVSVHDYGPAGADGAYLVMELVRGTSLRAELRRTGALLPPQAAELFDQILEGVRAAHAAGVVHRDLKPENVLLAPSDGRPPLVKILDFGIAKFTFVDREGAGLTFPGILLGTLGYMAPEQLEGLDADERCDLFSVGVMAFESVSGRRPFPGATHSEIEDSFRKGPDRLPGEGPEARALEEVLWRCLARSPAARPASAAELQRHLIPAMRACPPLPGSQASGEADTLVFKG